MRVCDYRITKSGVWLDGTRSESFSAFMENFKLSFPLDPNGLFFSTFGLNDIDTEIKQNVGEKLEEEFEIRVGNAIAASCTSEQLSLFNKLMEDDFTVIDYLDTLGDYHEDAFFKRYISAYGKEEETIDTLREYATLKWLPQNVPDYKIITEKERHLFMKDIISSWIEGDAKYLPCILNNDERYAFACMENRSQ